jgi:hypothetical protein
MNTRTLANHYEVLTAEERFRLIVAAGVRGDDAEQKRLISASGWRSFRQRDYMPFSEAFEELANVVYMAATDALAEFVEAEGRYTYAEELDTDEEFDAHEPTGAEDIADDDRADDEPNAVTADHSDDQDDERPERSLWQRFLDLWLATGFMLKTMVAGWELFCNRRQLPPFALWELLPGYERLCHYQTLIEGIPDLPGPAFAAEGIVRFLNDIRPTDEPLVVQADIISPECVADGLDELFNSLVKRHGGG